MCCALKQTQWRFLEYSWLRFFPSCNLILAIFLTFHFEKEMYHKPATPANSFFFALWFEKLMCHKAETTPRSPSQFAGLWHIYFSKFKTKHISRPRPRDWPQGGRVFWSNSFQSLKSTTIRLSTLITSSALWRVSKDWNSRSSFCRHRANWLPSQVKAWGKW